MEIEKEREKKRYILPINEGNKTRNDASTQNRKLNPDFSGPNLSWKRKKWLRQGWREFVLMNESLTVSIIVS